MIETPVREPTLSTETPVVDERAFFLRVINRELVRGIRKAPLLRTWSSTAPMLPAMGPVILIIFGIGSLMSAGSLGSQVVSTAVIVAGLLWLFIMTRLLGPHRPVAGRVVPGEVV